MEATSTIQRRADAVSQHEYHPTHFTADMAAEYERSWDAADDADEDDEDVCYVTVDGLPCDADGVVCEYGSENGWYDDAGNYCYYQAEEEDEAAPAPVAAIDPPAVHQPTLEVPQVTAAPTTQADDASDDDQEMVMANAYGLDPVADSTTTAQLRRAKIEGKTSVGELPKQPKPATTSAIAATAAKGFSLPRPKHLLAKVVSRRSTLTPLQRMDLVLNHQIPVSKWPAYGISTADPKCKPAAAASDRSSRAARPSAQEGGSDWVPLADLQLDSLSVAGGGDEEDDAPTVWSLGAPQKAATVATECMADTWDLLLECASSRPNGTILDGLIGCGWTLDLFIHLCGEDVSGHDIWTRLLACGFTGRYVRAAGPFYSPVLLTGRLGVGFGELHRDAGLTVRDLLVGEIGAGDVGQFMSRGGWRSVLPYMKMRMGMTRAEFCALGYTIPQWTCLLGMTYDLMLEYQILDNTKICERLRDRYSWTAVALATSLIWMEEGGATDTPRGRQITKWANKLFPLQFQSAPSRSPAPPLAAAAAAAAEEEEPPPPYTAIHGRLLQQPSQYGKRRPLGSGHPPRTTGEACYGWDSLTHASQ